ncbi:hypothetical protein FPK31_24245, partial [Acinetobacter baumannii]|nr:hypothetical protein [Acinetobacter baumannii]
MLVNICTVVPDGVVVFFPSYHFEEHVHNVWRQLGIDKRIEAKKKVSAQWSFISRNNT